MADLVMPKFGLTMTEGLLSEWYVSAGDAFRAGDILFTFETEKVASEVEAQADGVLAEILVPAGETVPVGTPVARIGKRAAISYPKPDTTKATQAADPLIITELKTDAKPDTRVIATPLARRIARQKSVDITQVKGSGPRGRIKADDVEAASTARDRASPTASKTECSTATEIKLDAIRLATARRVVSAKRNIPHFYVSHEAEISALSDLRQKLNVDNKGTRISITHMLIKAIGLALSELPSMNRIWANERILEFHEVDVGMVVETSKGLRIPVIRDAGRLELDRLATVAVELTARSRDGALTSEDVGDSVISISNVGMFGTSSLTPIINPPNAMILGVGADRKLFRPDYEDQPSLRHELTLTLACDHRIIDGANASRFLNHVVTILEYPLRLLRPAPLPAQQENRT
jgi:pyruvate dehydrogenase E2 component (dihydrolipoamide acetyltransferase)